MLSVKAIHLFREGVFRAVRITYLCMCFVCCVGVLFTDSLAWWVGWRGHGESPLAPIARKMDDEKYASSTLMGRAPECCFFLLTRWPFVVAHVEFV